MPKNGGVFMKFRLANVNDLDFLKEMYVGEGIKNKQKVMWKLKHGAGMVDIYVISMDTIIHCRHYIFKICLFDY